MARREGTGQRTCPPPGDGIVMRQSSPRHGVGAWRATTARRGRAGAHAAPFAPRAASDDRRRGSRVTKAPLVEIVDDDPGNQKLLRLLAEQAGCRVVAHVTAEAALLAARDEPPAVAVVDVQLSGRMDGLALVRALRAAPETAAVPIMVVSAFAALADEARARAAGCDVWMSKPIDTSEFMMRLRALVELSDESTPATA